jgi:hypothetical protein
MVTKPCIQRNSKQTVAVEFKPSDIKHFVCEGKNLIPSIEKVQNFMSINVYLRRNRLRVMKIALGIRHRALVIT